MMRGESNLRFVLGGICVFVFLVLSLNVVFATDAISAIKFNGNATASYDEGNFTLNWTVGADNANFSIYVSDDFGTTWFLKTGNDSVAGYSFSNKSLDANYSFRIETSNGTAIADTNSTIYNMTVDVTAPVISLPVYTNGSAKKNTVQLTLNVSLSDATSGLTGTHCIFDINGTNETVLISIGWCNTTALNLTNLADGNHTINVYVNDTVNNVGLNNSFVVQVDTTIPAGSYSCSPSSVNEGDSVTCSCSPSDVTSGINSSWTTFTSSPSTQSTGTFTLSCGFRDNAGNVGNTTTTYTVNGVSSGSSDGGSPSSGSKGTFAISQNQFQEGYTRTLTLGQRVRLTYNNEEHHVSILEFGEGTVKVEIASDPIEANLAVGDVRKFDLDGDGTYDLQVSLNSLEFSYADLTIVQISESITEGSESEQRAQESEATGVPVEEEPLTEGEDSSWIYWVIFGIVVIAVIVYFYYDKRKS